MIAPPPARSVVLMSSTEFSTLGLISLIGYVIVGVRLMNLCNASGVSNGWFSFVPLLNFTRWARLAGKNPWLVLLFVIPPVGMILSWLWLARISDETGTKSPWFFVYLIATIVALLSPLALNSPVHLIAVIILVVAQIAAQWMIFDPAKPIRTTTPSTV